ncbi:MAG: SIS domain-containing protein [Patescibacteria group bacterium]
MYLQCERRRASCPPRADRCGGNISILDNQKIFSSVDSENVVKYIDDFADQVENTWLDLTNIVLPSYYIKIKNVIICGMGGSNLAGEIINSLYTRSTRPVKIIEDYEIPDYVDNETLAIFVSFSGNTEETVISYKKATKKGARAFVISTGGALIEMAKSDEIPYFHYQYDSPPRFAVGISFTAVLSVLNKLAVINLSNIQIKEAILMLNAWTKKLSVDIPTARNSAKQLAGKLFDKFPVIVGMGEIAGVARTWEAQLNETAKTAAVVHTLPNLNHFAVSGTKFPKKSAKLFYIIIQSKYIDPRLKIQENLLIQVLDKAGINYETVFMHPTNDFLSEIYLNILFAEYIGYYLAILNKINPSVTPLQSFIKNSLAEKE